MVRSGLAIRIELQVAVPPSLTGPLSLAPPLVQLSNLPPLSLHLPLLAPTHLTRARTQRTHTQVQRAVSLNKRRFVDAFAAGGRAGGGGLDLDLTYLCDRLIGMGIPCVEGAVYRNDIREAPRPQPSRARDARNAPGPARASRAAQGRLRFCRGANTGARACGERVLWLARESARAPARSRGGFRGGGGGDLGDMPTCS
jgi:hypothetical protein